MHEKLIKIRELINAELNLCNGEETPYVCSMLHGEHKEILVDKVYDYVIKQGLNIADAILMVEAEYNPNQKVD